MTLADVAQRLAAIIHALTGVPIAMIHDNARLEEDLGLDSLLLAELLAAAEREFRVPLHDHRAGVPEGFGSVARMVFEQLRGREGLGARRR